MTEHTPSLKFHRKSLRNYITIMLTGIITAVLTLLALFFYVQTSRTLHETYQEQMIQQLNTTMDKINEQMNLIDSLYPLFVSNSLIYDSMENDFSDGSSITSIEKQMAYLLITNYVWEEKFIKSVHLYSRSGNVCQVSFSDKTLTDTNALAVFEDIDKDYPSLQMTTMGTDMSSLYFIRNIFSSSTGQYLATMIISVDSDIWMNYLGSSLEDDWFISIHNDNIHLFSKYGLDISQNEDQFLTVSETLKNLGLTADVVAPKAQLDARLTSVMQSYLLVILLLIGFAFCISLLLSRAITRPISTMIGHINKVAEGHYEESMPKQTVFEEFDLFVSSFNHMLHEISTYHSDQLQKQLLLKNAEIKALQSQINPHFLFNIMNTLAWKAQMSDTPELYQMIISLGELLKANAVSKDTPLIPLKSELHYIKLYVYLQKMRFEDKIQVSFDIESGLDDVLVPYFGIQSLVENAFVHGLEPKKGNGHLSVLISKVPQGIHVSVQDNGIGFLEIPDLEHTRFSETDRHTHIGLGNLNKRLLLLYGKQAHLTIESKPNVLTTVSFIIPSKEGAPL